jgi:nucleoside-diphosphate-sugar epimerase
MIAITGANGLLGSFIVRKLIEKQIPFVALKREFSDTSLLDDVQEKILWRNADVLNPVQIHEALDGCTHVIHAAAFVSFNPYKANQVSEINVIGTRHVVNACQERNIKRLVHISSVAALGKQKDQHLIDEENKWIENPYNSVYADSKYRAELEVYRAQEEGLNTIIINPSVILSASDWNRSSAQLFKYVKQQKPFYIDAFLNYVDVRDVAFCACEFLDREEQAQRFIISAGNISFKNFFEKMAGHFHTKAPSIKLSKRMLKIVSEVETLRSWFTRSEPIVTRETARLAGTHFLYNNKKIREILNFEFQTIDNTLEWCCRHYIQKIGPKK